MLLNNGIKRLLGVASFTMCALMLSPMASAIVLTPGSSTPVLTPLPTITFGSMIGTLNTGYTTAPVSPTQYIAGTLYSRVFSGDTGNPGGLDFFYEVTNTGGLNDAVGLLTLNGFAGFITDVYTYLGPVDGLTSGSVAPSAPNASPVEDRTPSGNTLHTFFRDANGVGTIAPGLTSEFILIRTNATAYTSVFGGVSDGNTANPAMLSPAAAPEPASIVFFGSCLLGIAGFMRRRNSGIQLS